MNTQSQGASAPTVFQFQESTQLRVVTIDGEPWFVAADVCAALSITNEQTRRLDEDEKGLRSIQTPGGQQEMTVINESGLYSLILGSRKPEAKPFKKWVTSEVLPSIRKTGSYSVIPNNPPADETLTAQDHNNLQRLIWSVSGYFRFKDAWAQGCWRAIRIATNTPSPHKFRVSDLPLVAAELRRIWAVSHAASHFISQAESAFLKKALRGGVSIESVLAEQQAALVDALKTDAAELEAKVKAWQVMELGDLTGRKPSENHHYDVREILP